jgi:hypothetical protein
MAAALRRNDLDRAEHRPMLGGGEAGISCHLSGGECMLVGQRAEHAQRGVPAGGVVVLDPGSDPGPGLCFGGEALDGAQLKLQRGMPRFDGGIVQRRQMLLIPMLGSGLSV